MPLNSPPAFEELLRQYRAAAGLTQEELAEAARLSARAISDLERGVKHRPHGYTVERLAAALGLSAADRAAFADASRRVGRADSPAGQGEQAEDAVHLPV